MTQPSILLEIDQGVALLTLNRPDNLNSFNVEMHERMRDAISTVRKDESVRVLVITGSGRGFCAGQDLSERLTRSGNAGLGRLSGELLQPADAEPPGSADARALCG